MSDGISSLKKVVFSGEREAALKALTEIIRLGSEEAFPFCVGLLDTESAFLRNAAAIELMQLADSRAVEPLLRAIHEPEHFNANGTLVYALSAFDCSQLLKELLLIVFYQSYEAKLMALNILEEQEFNYTEEDALEVRQHWVKVSRQPEQALQEVGIPFLKQLVEQL